MPANDLNGRFNKDSQSDMVTSHLIARHDLEERFGKMETRRSLIACAWLFLTPAALLGQVEGFEESFTGQGVYQSVGTNYDGLDNVAWTMHATGLLTEEGYSFNLHGTGSPVTLQERVSRQVYGQGSFLHEIVFKDLVLGDHDEGHREAASEVQLSHFLEARELDPEVRISLSDPDEAGVWRLDIVTIEDRRIGQQTALVPKGSEYVRLALRYDRESMTINGFYDSNIFDEHPPVVLELPLATELSPESETQLSIATVRFDLSGVINSWSLTPLPNLTGDFSGNGDLDVADIDQLSSQVRGATNDARFDLDSNMLVDLADIAVWVHDLKKTYFGDANLDGEFNSQDLVQVYQAGKFESGQPAGWAEGDWDPNGIFNVSDAIAAFFDGGYEAGPRPAISPVPEPSPLAVVGLGLLAVRPRRRSAK